MLHYLEFSNTCIGSDDYVDQRDMHQVKPVGKVYIEKNMYQEQEKSRICNIMGGNNEIPCNKDTKQQLIQDNMMMMTTIAQMVRLQVVF